MHGLLFSGSIYVVGGKMYLKYNDCPLIGPDERFCCYPAGTRVIYQPAGGGGGGEEPPPSEPVLEPPVASFTYVPETPMAGGQIEFDGTHSEGDIQEYRWDFGNGDSASGRDGVVREVYRKPGIYTVTLVVRNSQGEESEPAVKKLDLRLKNGDLLLCRSRDSLVPGYWSHIGIYDEAGNNVIEARMSPSGVRSFPFSDWVFPNQRCVRAIRVATSQEIRDAAVSYAHSQEPNSRYDLLSILLGVKDVANSDERGWYCSELVWASYLEASDTIVDLDPDEWEVSPDEIAGSSEIEKKVVGMHVEEEPDTFWSNPIWGRTRCPVDLAVTDPEGRTLSKGQSQIPDALYEEFDEDGDGDLDDFFAIPNAKPGEYLIRVIPEPNTLPEETYSLEVNVDGKSTVLARNVLVRNTPQEPYTLVVEDTNARAPLPEPVAHWKFDEGTGWIAADSVGGNDARIGGIRWTQGVLGGALSFDGVKNRADSGNAAVLAPEELTITFWSTTEKIGAEQYIVAKGPAPNTAFDPDYVVSYSQDDRMKFCFGESREQYIRVLSEPIKQPDRWIHVAAVRDGSKAMLYLNAKLVASENYAFVPVEHSYYFLTFGAGSQFRCPLLGKIDDVRIYDKPLGAEEIQELYTQVSP